MVLDADDKKVEVPSTNEPTTSVSEMPSSLYPTPTILSSTISPAALSFVTPSPMPSTPSPESLVLTPPRTKLTKPQLEEIPKLVLFELRKDDIVVVVQALSKLYNMLKSEKKNSQRHKRKATMAGAAGAIVRAMRKWQWDQVIQVRGCNCLRRLSCENIDGVCSVAQSGGVEATIDAMAAFPQCPYVQNRAVGVLQNTLSVSLSDPCVIAVTNRFVKVLDGIRLVLRAMKNFPDDADIQADCCALFHNLAIEDDMKDLMARAGVVSTVAITLERHYDNPEVKEEVDNFMAQMFARETEGEGATYRLPVSAFY